MNDRKIFCLYVDVYVNGSWKNLQDVPEDGLFAICEAIEDLWNPTYHSRREYSALPNEERDIIYLVYLEDGASTPFPAGTSEREITVGAPGKTLKLVGDRIPIKVLGTDRIHVQFSDV